MSKNKQSSTILLLYYAESYQTTIITLDNLSTYKQIHA